MKLKKRKGFTIVEMIVVLAIIAILTLIAVPMYSKYIDTANKVKDDALVRVTYEAAVAYYYDNELTAYLNPSQEQLGPYLSSDVEIVSGIGEDNCNEYGHYMWGSNTRKDVENIMCVHIVLEGGTYKGAGITEPADENYIVIEMYDPNIDKKFNENSETNVNYYKLPF